MTIAFWGIITVMSAQFLGFAIGIAIYVALAYHNKYAAFANLALYVGFAVYGCIMIAPWLLFPMVVFAVIGKLSALVIVRKWNEWRDNGK
jgi:hypothetical protein